jgi:hypothetical protein
MCKLFDIPREVVFDFVSRKHKFEYNELTQVIIQKGGVLRVSPNRSVKEYLLGFVEDGILKYGNNHEEYVVAKH